jgi:hypothetical protein
VDAGFDLLIVPNLYNLDPAGDHAAHLRELQGRAMVASWMHPRPAYWIMRALGVPSETRLICRNIGEFCCPDVAVNNLIPLAARHCQTQSGAGSGRVVDVSAAVDARWYPVIDYSRCSQCGQCLEFCLFGVFSRIEDRVVASHRDNCKPGCPACARVCPRGAIMFPQYDSDPAIAGHPGAGSPAGGIDVGAFFGDMDASEVSPELQAAAERAACACEHPTGGRDNPPGDCSGECGGNGDEDELDDLIAALQNLDE